MTRNMGQIDRMLRAVVAAPLLIIVAVVVGATTLGGILALIGAAVMLATAAMGSCPLYSLFGLDTCPRVGSH